MVRYRVPFRLLECVFDVNVLEFLIFSWFLQTSFDDNSQFMIAMLRWVYTSDWWLCLPSVQMGHAFCFSVFSFFFLVFDDCILLKMNIASFTEKLSFFFMNFPICDLFSGSVDWLTRHSFLYWMSLTSSHRQDCHLVSTCFPLSLCLSCVYTQKKTHGKQFLTFFSDISITSSHCSMQGKQRLLYSLLDAMQSVTSQAVVIGVSCRLVCLLLTYSLLPPHVFSSFPFLSWLYSYTTETWLPLFSPCCCAVEC